MPVGMVKKNTHKTHPKTTQNRFWNQHFDDKINEIHWIPPFWNHQPGMNNVESPTPGSFQTSRRCMEMTQLHWPSLIIFHGRPYHFDRRKSRNFCPQGLNLRPDWQFWQCSVQVAWKDPVVKGCRHTLGLCDSHTWVTWDWKSPEQCPVMSS